MPTDKENQLTSLKIPDSEGTASPENKQPLPSAQIFLLIRAALDSTHEPILITDFSGTILYYNRSFQQFWDSAAEQTDSPALELIRNIRELFSAEEDCAARLLEICNGREDAVDQFELKNGHLIKCTSEVQYVDGEVLGRTWSFLDVDEERQLQEAALRLAAVVESTDDAVISKDLNGIITSWNHGAGTVFGYSAGEVLGKSINILFPPERIDEEREILARIRRGERVEPYETVRVRKEGVRIHVSLSVSPIKNSRGKIVGASKIARDITERKRIEKAVRRSERELRAMADSISPLAWMADQNGQSGWFNRRWFEYTGRGFNELKREGWLNLLHPSQRYFAVERWHSSVSSGQPFEMELRLRGADGSYRWFLSRVNPLRDENGEILRWFGTNSDVHGVKRVEEELRRRSETLQLLNETGKRLNSTLMLNELLEVVTDAATRLSGAQFGTFLYNDPEQYVDSYADFTRRDGAGVRRSGAEAPSASGVNAFQLEEAVRIENTETDERYLQWSPYFNFPEELGPVRSFLGVPVISRSGNVLGGLFFGHSQPNALSGESEEIVLTIASQAAVAIDNAELYEDLRQAAAEREALLDAERSARTEAERISLIKDEFLATLSHELRTPLNAILGWSQLLASAKGDPAYLDEGLEVIERNARTQTQLIEDLLDMNRIVAGKISLNVQRIGLTEVIEAALAATRPAVEAKGIRLRKILDPNAGPVSGDPTRLQQIFWNLLTNAVKFTPKGGRVDVLLQRVNSHVEVTVSDSGIGIKPEDLSCVFERFRQVDSSASRKYSGLGLGLAIVKHLVELHGGTVSADSEGEGKGATFVVALPLAPIQKVEDREHPRNPTGALPLWPELTLEGLTILLVDDEPDARMLLSRVLSQFKATVQTAASAEEAMEIIRESRPDVLISDIGMPGTDGYSFIRQVRKLPSENGGRIPAIALTAFARSEDRTRAMMAGYQVHIAKPIEPRELAATVGSLAGRIMGGVLKNGVS